jgi:hypothetical protein
MLMKEKERYFAPEAYEFKVQFEGVICASTVDANGVGIGDYTNPFGDETIL